MRQLLPFGGRRHGKRTRAFQAAPESGGGAEAAGKPGGRAYADVPPLVIITPPNLMAMLEVLHPNMIGT